MGRERRVRLAILGSGPAGYTAAIYAARANLAPLLIQGLQPGGQLAITTEVENFPGFPEPILGPELMERMAEQARRCGAELVADVAVAVELRERPFRIVLDGGDRVFCDALIIATGAQARWLGLPSEARFRGFGVSGCATCDGFFFRNKPVAVVGGGNTAVEEALFLARLCSKVFLVHRRDSLRAEKVLQQRLFAEPKIEPVWNHVVEEIVGTEEPRAVTGVRLRDLRSGAVRELAVEGLFVAIGHDPATALFKNQLDMDEQGYIVTAPGSTRTSVPGVFAAGDVQDKWYRQAVTAAGTGCMAALEADRWLAEQGSA
ncbi:MAG: thioredoxin-disulfide reductase [Geminicoccaceae bacterium]|nr:thioredoxin-disulfide reductase [Geminicoccaceae bacterium]MCS7266480.1 thioredoxin-disulfide reductase [Geminicoccaceae bacterium]MCX7629391.1 thioredoxin-disulfide reductase [Geminicoccaceae bacterium]MDW8123924.1 thioredoxin-disulfide reductase [Geminicoccaceae bacterium]MDW8340013.1 thioredoxin-disulfide reductase [Geminicoccaceae bacterium]